MVSLRRLTLAVTAALLALGIFAAWHAAQMPMGSAALPGPAVMPLALGILLALCSAALIATEIASPATVERVPLGHRHVLLAIAAVVLAGIAWERAGFAVTSTAFLFVLLWTLSTLGWWRSLLAALAASMAAGFVFQRFLGVNLPPLPI
jgi:hypothetical protein